MDVWMWMHVLVCFRSIGGKFGNAEGQCKANGEPPTSSHSMNVNGKVNESRMLVLRASPFKPTRTDRIDITNWMIVWWWWWCRLVVRCVWCEAPPEVKPRPKRWCARVTHWANCVKQELENAFERKRRRGTRKPTRYGYMSLSPVCVWAMANIYKPWTHKPNGTVVVCPKYGRESQIGKHDKGTGDMMPFGKIISSQTEYCRPL